MTIISVKDKLTLSEKLAKLQDLSEMVEVVYGKSSYTKAKYLLLNFYDKNRTYLNLSLVNNKQFVLSHRFKKSGVYLVHRNNYGIPITVRVNLEKDTTTFPVKDEHNSKAGQTRFEWGNQLTLAEFCRHYLGENDTILFIRDLSESELRESK